MATLAVDRPVRRMLRPLHWIMLGMIVGAFAVGGFALRQGAVVPYLTVSEAKAAPGNVQVFGFLHSPGAYDADGAWTFEIQGEDGAVVAVLYAKSKPANFEQAVSVVATGSFDAGKNAFVADDLLVKCPSKYQEAETASR